MRKLFKSTKAASVTKRMVPELIRRPSYSPAEAALFYVVYEEQFCRRVADGHVIRYDLRDTGRWVTCEAGTQQYTLHNLAGDALQLLDSLRVTKSNLVGFSGGVGQPIAIEHPERVDSVALISPSPAPA
jgi:pimeloyl-ACP methyl ester carboxylesterase